MRDQNLLAMYGAWDALKNEDNAYPNSQAHLGRLFIAGKRESRRLLGDVVLRGGRPIRPHVSPTPASPAPGGLTSTRPTRLSERGSRAGNSSPRRLIEASKTPYWAPYRCLYSRNVANLFMAGRDISVTHEALGTVRVMRTGGAWAKSSAWPPRSAFITARRRAACMPGTFGS